MSIKLGRLRSERGGGLGAIVALIALLLAIYVCVKVIPLRVQKAEFADWLENELRNYSLAHLNQESFTERVLQESL